MLKRLNLNISFLLVLKKIDSIFRFSFSLGWNYFEIEHKIKLVLSEQLFV